MALLDSVIWRNIYLNGALVVDQPQALDFVGDNVSVETVNGRTQIKINTVDQKDSVAAGSTEDLTLSGEQTVDTVALVAGDRVLVKDQDAGEENGIYVVSAGAWARSDDADSDAEVTTGLLVYVEAGTQKGYWTLVTPAPIVVGVTELVFERSSFELSDLAPVTLDGGAGDAGTAITASRSDHKHYLNGDVAPNAITFTSPSYEGVAASFSRSDHVHAVAEPTVLPANVGTAAASAGTQEFAHADHSHQADTAAPDATGVATAAEEGSASTLARSDHKHQANTAPANVTKDTAAIGTSGEMARADHKHDVSTAAPTGGISIGSVSTEGTATTLARSDHVHAVAAPSAPENVTKAAASAGVSANLARQDHKHDVTTAAPSAVGTANTEGSASSLARSDHVHDASALLPRDGSRAMTGALAMGGNLITGLGSVTLNAETDDGNSGATKTVDFATVPAHKLTLTHATPVITWAFPGRGWYQCKLFQDGTGNRVPTYAVSGGTVYASNATLSTAADAKDIVSIYYDGTDAWMILAPNFV